MNKHTPGPWKVFENDAHCPGIDSATQPTTIVLYGMTFEEMTGVRGETIEEAHANARLIAAAPEMLDMLKRVEWWLSITEDSKLMQDAVREVIIKAQGEL